MSQTVCIAFFFVVVVVVAGRPCQGGFVDTAVRMHDGVLDEVDVGSGRIMELRDGGEGWRGSVRKGAGGAR